MLRFTSLLFAVFYFSAMACCSQHLLFHKNQNKEVLYTVGDMISFSTREDDSKMRSRILGFEGDSLIVFQNYTINPASITTLYVDEKVRGLFALRFNIDKLLIRAGFGYTLLELINQGLINRNGVSTDAVITGVSLVAAGLIAKAVIGKRIKIKGRTKLLIIHQE